MVTSDYDTEASSSHSVLITGATGFIGSAIVSQCQAAGLLIRTTGRAELPSNSLPNYRKADLLDPAGIAPLLKGVGSVVHSAGLAHQFDLQKSDSAQFLTVNVEGTANIVQAAGALGVRHFVLIGSVSVYGSYPTDKCDELSPCHPNGPYAQSKYLAEQRAIKIAKKEGMSLTILRLATVYGEGDPGNIARLMRAIDRGRFVWVGDGSNRKSLLYRGDAARACLAVLQQPTSGINIYNVSAPPCAMRDVVEGLASALGWRVPRLHVPASLALRLTEVAARLARGRGRLASLHATIQKWLADDAYDTNKFRQTFGFLTEMRLPEGLRREVAWYRNQTH
jgi:nucleoside-diphosphate-sugar epimerase